LRINASTRKRTGSVVRRVSAGAWCALLAAVGAVVLVTPQPASAADEIAAPQWAHAMRHQPWGLFADRRGAVVINDGYGVQSLDREGSVQWTTRLESVVQGTPTSDASRVLVGGRGRVTMLTRDRGTPRWWQRMDGDVTGAALARGLAFVGDHAGTLAVFDAGTGSKRWSVHFDGEMWTAPRIDRDSGVVVASWHRGPDPAVRVFDADSGELRWDAPTDRFAAAPVVASGLVVVAVGDGHEHARVEARDLVTGELRWSTVVPRSFEAGIEPVADGADVFVVDNDGGVSVLELQTGDLLWQHDVGYVTSETRMALTDSRVVFTSFSGDVFVLDRGTGKLAGHYSAAQLGGYPIGATVPAWQPESLLLGLRYDEPYRVELRPLA
jgi:outer membrane protein assembly factor BamB